MLIQKVSFILFESIEQIWSNKNAIMFQTYSIRNHLFSLLSIPSTLSDIFMRSLSRIYIMKMVTNTFHCSKDKTNHFQLLYDNLMIENNEVCS